MVNREAVNPYQSPEGLAVPGLWEQWGWLARGVRETAVVLLLVVLLYGLLPLWLGMAVVFGWSACTWWERGLLLLFLVVGCLGWGVFVGELWLSR